MKRGSKIRSEPASTALKTPKHNHRIKYNFGCVHNNGPLSDCTMHIFSQSGKFYSIGQGSWKMERKKTFNTGILIPQEERKLHEKIIIS
jgi:hypothetical protein